MFDVIQSLMSYNRYITVTWHADQSQVHGMHMHMAS